MPTVIDSFVIELGLDPKQFTKGQQELMDNLRKMQEQAEKGGKEIESQGKKLGEFFGNVKAQAIGALAIFLGGRGIKEFVGYMTSLDAATGRVGHTMNTSAREVSAWQGAIEQNGGSAESATASLAGLSGEMNKFMLTGQASFLPILNAMDIGLFDGNKKLKTSAALLLDISDKMKGMDPARAAAMLSMIPGMNQDMVNLLIQGRAAVVGYLDAARQAGGTTAESAAAAAAYQKQLALLGRTASDTGRSILTYFIPAMVEGMRLVGAFFRVLNNPKQTDVVEKEVDQTRSRLIKKFGDPREFLNRASEAWNDSVLATAFGKSVQMGEHFYGSGGAAAAPPRPVAVVPIKLGAGASSPATESVMRAISGMGDVKQVTALNDPYHAFLGGSHPAGRAVDVTIKDPAKSADVAEAIRAKLAASGITAKVVDEYKNPSKNATGGHIHIGVAPPAAVTSSFGAPAAAISNSSRGGDDNRRTSSTTVGQVNVYTQATDGEGVARDIKPAMERASFAASANTGLE